MQTKNHIPVQTANKLDYSECNTVDTVCIVYMLLHCLYRTEPLYNKAYIQQSLYTTKQAYTTRTYTARAYIQQKPIQQNLHTTKTYTGQGLYTTKPIQNNT